MSGCRSEAGRLPKYVISHSTMKNNCNITGCCNNTHLGAPRTSKHCVSDFGDASHVTCRWNIKATHSVTDSCQELFVFIDKSRLHLFICMMRWDVMCSVENLSKKVRWRVTTHQKLSSPVISRLPVCLTQLHWKMWVFILAVLYHCCMAFCHRDYNQNVLSVSVFHYCCIFSSLCT